MFENTQRMVTRDSLRLKWLCIWQGAHHHLFRTQNSKFRTWDLTYYLPVLMWDLTSDLNTNIWYLCVTYSHLWSLLKTLSKEIGKLALTTWHLLAINMKVNGALNITIKKTHKTLFKLFGTFSSPTYHSYRKPRVASVWCRVAVSYSTSWLSIPN